MMRIITGSARGVRLDTLEGEMTRPTTERAKEAVFSILRARTDLSGARVLDLFAGCGQLGLEALSAGAAHAVLVDQSREAVRVMEKNAAKTLCHACRSGDGRGHSARPPAGTRRTDCL